MECKNMADIGVFGGSGFYKFLDDIKEVKLETPYGAPSNSLENTMLHSCQGMVQTTVFYPIK